MRRLLPAAAAAVAALLTVGGAWATPTLDQQQPTIDRSANSLSIGSTYQQRLAQTVTAGVAGLLTEVRLPVSCAGTSNLLVEIYDGPTTPGLKLRSSQSVPGAAVPFFPTLADVSLRSLSLAAPPFIAAGGEFAIIVSSTLDGCSTAVGPVGDAYAGGQLYFDSRPNPPGLWVCNCDFAGERFDLPFQTFVEPMCQVPDVVGEKRTNAIRVIERYGCSPRKVGTAFSRTAKKGVVIAVSPRPGQQLSSGSPVEITVSLGRPCLVPNVKGRAAVVAATAIRKAGCRIGAVTYTISKTIRKGRVVAQRPTAGRTVLAGTPVRLVVSRGTGL